MPAAHDLVTQLHAATAIDIHLIADGSRPTTVKTRYVADGQQIMRADRESRAPLSAAIEQRVLEIFHTILDAADVVILSDYAKGVLTDSLTRALIDSTQRADKTIIVDPKSKDFSKYSGANVLTPNRLELQIASGRSCTSTEQIVDEAKRALAHAGLNVMVVTRGKDGVSVVDRGDLAVHIPAVARQVFDVSGAGDTMVAAMSLGLAGGAQIVESATLANVAAGIAVGKRGTATVTTGEIIAELRALDGRPDPRKIFSLQRAFQLTQLWRDQGLTVAFTNGCFDLLHPGHLSLLEQARRSADRLIVGLNSDESIRRLKGSGRPVQSEVARATVLEAVKSVDAVVIFADDTPLELITKLEPDVLVKGADYTIETVVGAELVQARGGKVLLARLLPDHSTTDTLRKIGVSTAS